MLRGVRARRAKDRRGEPVDPGATAARFKPFRQAVCCLPAQRSVAPMMGRDLKIGM